MKKIIAIIAIIIVFIIGLSLGIFFSRSKISIEEGYEKKSPDSKWEFSTETGYSKNQNKYYIVYELRNEKGRYFYLEYPINLAVSARESKLDWDNNSTTVTSIVPCYDGAIKCRIYFEIDVMKNDYKIKKMKP